MEAQLCQTPVLGSDLGGIPELVKEGVTGELFESGNAQLLKEKIEFLWKHEDRLQTYTENCKDVHFDDVGKYVENLMKIYQN